MEKVVILDQKDLKEINGRVNCINNTVSHLKDFLEVLEEKQSDKQREWGRWDKLYKALNEISLEANALNRITK